MAKSVNVEFYRLSVDDARALAEAVERVANIPNNGSRNLVLDKVPYRIEETFFEGSLIEGDAVRIRTTDLPSKAPLRGKRASLNLQPSDGIGEASAFLFDPEIRVLVYQRNKFGVSVDTFCRYIEAIISKRAPLMPELVIDPEALRQLRELKSVSSFELGIAKVDNPTYFRSLKEANPDMEGVIDFMEQLHGVNAKILVGVGRTGRVLSKGGIMNLVHRVLRFRQEHESLINVVKIRGLDTEFQPDEINILKHRVQYSDDVQQSREPHEFYQRRRGVLHQAWQDKRELLRSLFRNAPPV